MKKQQQHAQNTNTLSDAITYNDVTIAVELITPDYAREVLLELSTEHNKKSDSKKQRELSQSRLNYLTNEFKNGHWRFNGDTIVFDNEGFLIDGQGRLTAIVATNIAREYIVVRGINTDALTTIDTGTSRSLSDLCYMQGMQNAAHVQAFTYMQYGYENTGRPTMQNVKPMPGPGDLLDWVLTRQQEIAAAVQYSVDHRRDVNAQGIGIPPSLVAWVRYNAMRIDEMLGSRFCDALTMGENVSGWKNIAKLRQWLFQYTKSQPYPWKEARAAAIVKTWNAEMMGIEARSLNHHQRSPFPTWIEGFEHFDASTAN